jgi:hypothetical protein
MRWAKEPSCFSVLRSKNAEAGGSDVSTAGEVLDLRGSKRLFMLSFKRRQNLALLWIASAILVSAGCASLSPLRPRTISADRVYQSERLVDDQAQIQYGKRRPIIDGLGWIIGIPSKILLWNHRVDNHNIRPETERAVAAYLNDNGLATVRVRMNQYHPIDDWRRLTRNDSVGAGWRYTFGVVSVLGEAVFPGRIIGGDHFNPYTNTIHLYSDIPAIALHEAGHAKDFARRKWKGTYAAAYLLPIVPLYHESLASNDVYAYLETNGTVEEQADARKILTPAFGTYIGGAAGSVFPQASVPLYYGSVVTGHLVGRYQSNRILNQPGTAPLPTPNYAQLDSPTNNSTSRPIEPAQTVGYSNPVSP